jgi:hypothetical protein
LSDVDVQEFGPTERTGILDRHFGVSGGGEVEAETGDVNRRVCFL